MRRKLQTYVTHLASINVVHPLSNATRSQDSGGDEQNWGIDFHDKNPYISQEDVDVITGIDRLLLQLSVKRSVVQVFSGLTENDRKMLDKCAAPLFSDAIDESEFLHLRTIFEAVPCKLPAVSDALEMYDLSDSETDKQASMKEFMVQFYQAIKK